MLIEDLTKGFEGFFVDQLSALDRVQVHASRAKVEQDRVQALIRADRLDRATERARSEAIEQLESGLTVNAEAAVVGPTPELLAKGNFRNHTVAVGDEHGPNVRTVATFRRREEVTIQSMWMNGALSDECYAACKWLRACYEAGDLEPNARVSNYEMTISAGDIFYAHLPHSAFAAEARADFHSAMKIIPEQPTMLKSIFKLVVLSDYSLEMARREHGCRHSTAKSAVVIGANRLYEGVSSRLDVAKIIWA